VKNAASSHPPKTAPEDPPASDPQQDSDSEDDDPSSSTKTKRDVGVSGKIWKQLQEDTRKAEAERKERQRLEEEEEALRRWLKKCEDAQRQHELEEIERRKHWLEEKLRQEAEDSARLQRSGLCPMGYRWIKQSGGYRCAGGSHWVSDAQIQNMRG
jgi:predicted RNase H-like nuclease (RuvC/YqgF family)